MKRLVICICVPTPLEIFSKTKKRLIGVLFLTGLMFAASCIPDRQPKPPAKPVERADGFVVFLTGSELGALKPCGCSGGQLGGFDRRWAVLNSVPRQRKLIVDTGSLVESDSQQDLIKFSIIIQALGLLDYDLVNLTEKDLQIAQNLGLLNNPAVGFISPYGAGEKIAAIFRNKYLIKGKYITISILTFDVETSQIEQIREAFPQELGQQSVNILIINRCDDAIISSISELGIVDCLVCPSDSDEPRVIGAPNKKPLVFSVGRFGRYVCALQITEVAQEQNKLKLDFDTIAVEEKLPQGPSLVQLYKDYQQLVKEANLLEKYPRFVLPNDLKYVSSESCKPCHEYEYQVWRETTHAQAYATLDKAGSQYDPQCVICHVVGMEYESGFISEEKTSHLKDVGCENCHGPGSEHVRTLGKAKTTQPKSSCLDCHTPEKSGEYAGNEQRYLEKIIHWKQPKTAGDTQKAQEGSQN